MEAAKAATQGIYKMVKARKLKALSGENIWVSIALSCASLEAPVRIVRVLTTDSFAVNPVMRAVDARQSLNPIGAKAGAMIEPIEARMLFALSATMFSLQSKLCRNQITMEAIKIMVNALCRKSFPFSHMWSKTLLASGRR